MRLERFDLAGDSGHLARELRAAGGELSESVAAGVASTIAAVRGGGDAAVIDLTERFDGVAVGSLRVGGAEVEAALTGLAPELRAALELAADNIRAVAGAQPAGERQVALEAGQRITLAEVPVAAAGIYAPGGRAPYPSSVLMGVIPAVVAGVGRVAVASPPAADGLPDRAVLAAARIAGASEVYAVGGAQAIAALTYGTESVAPVDVIAGPGSPWVQEAKLQCSRRVGIDGYAGPSELLVVCDASAEAGWVAIDLLAQAEHGADGLLAVASPDPEVLDAVAGALEGMAADRSSVDAAVRVALIAVVDLEAAVALSEALAPEHLELACEGAAAWAERISTAGCVFVGPCAGAAFGDYAAGSNHVLPTGGAGRFSGPLGPGTFRRRISRVEIGAAAAEALSAAVDAVARAEGFPVHGESALVRSSGPTEQAS